MDHDQGGGRDNIEPRLLQLTHSRSATVHAGTSSTRPERRSTSGVRAERKRSRHRQFDTVVLATTPLNCALSSICVASRILFLWQLPRILNRNCNLFSFRIQINILPFLSYGRDSASVPSHTLGPQRGTLCLQTFVLSGHESVQTSRQDSLL